MKRLAATINTAVSSARAAWQAYLDRNGPGSLPEWLAKADETSSQEFMMQHLVAAPPLPERSTAKDRPIAGSP